MGKINDLTKDKEIWHLNPLKKEKEKRNINDGPRWGFFLWTGPSSLHTRTDPYFGDD
jgi:hypothetical protein